MVQLLLCSVNFAISHKHMLLIESGFQILTFPPFVPILLPKVQPTHHASLTNKQSNAKNTDRHYRDVSGSTSFCIDSVKSRTSPGNDEGMCNICSLILGAGWSAEILVGSW